METKLLFATFLEEIKAKCGLSNATLAKYLDCSESAVSLYINKKSMVSYPKVLNLVRCLKEIEYQDIYDYVFNYFPGGYYHGSRQGIQGEIDYKRNKNKALDFGYGFYLGTSFKQSSTFVVEEETGKDRVYKFSFSLDGLDVLELRDIRWVLFVAYNRNKIPNTIENRPLIKEMKRIEEHGYDVVVGPIADDKMAISMENFFNNNISYGQLLKCLTQLKIGDQYCLKTQKAIDNLKYEVIYSTQDDALRRLIRDYAEMNVLAASKHAEAINSQYDDGKKFKDLLKEYGKKSIF